jgi:hypothetical protein
MEPTSLKRYLTLAALCYEVTRSTANVGSYAVVSAAPATEFTKGKAELGIWIAAIWPNKADEETRYYGTWDTEKQAAEFLLSTCREYDREGETILVELPIEAATGLLQDAEALAAHHDPADGR